MADRNAVILTPRSALARSPKAGSSRKTPSSSKRRDVGGLGEQIVTRPTDVDPKLLAASRQAHVDAARRRAWLEQTWLTVRFIGAGFLLGAIAVHAIASVRMARRIDTLTARLDQVVVEQQRLAGRGEPLVPTNARAPGVALPRPHAAPAAPATSPARAEDPGLVFPALDLAAPSEPKPEPVSSLPVPRTVAAAP